MRKRKRDRGHLYSDGGAPMKVMAYAKVNLSLDILGRRADGYHELELIFQPVSLMDELTVELREGPGMEFSCSAEELSGPDNLVCRAYGRLQRDFPELGGCCVRLEKNIPTGAGMGGGSTDAAAFLKAARELWSLPLTDGDLCRIGAELGADVPACLIETATLGRGIGERLEILETVLDYPLLVIKPEVSFNTGEMYRRYDALTGEETAAPARHAAAVAAALQAGDLKKLGENLYNAFEKTVPEVQMIGELKHRLLAAGAAGALMTGSGSAVFGIFADRNRRDAVYEQWKAEGNIYRCEAVNHGKRKRS